MGLRVLWLTEVLRSKLGVRSFKGPFAQRWINIGQLTTYLFVFRRKKRKYCSDSFLVFFSVKLKVWSYWFYATNVFSHNLDPPNVFSKFGDLPNLDSFLSEFLPKTKSGSETLCSQLETSHRPRTTCFLSGKNCWSVISKVIHFIIVNFEVWEKTKFPVHDGYFEKIQWVWY